MNEEIEIPNGEGDGYMPAVKEEKLKRSAGKTVAAKNNYSFHNCTVTINEEGKAIDILAKKEANVSLGIETGMKIVGDLISIFSKKPERATDAPQPAPEPAPTPQKKRVVKTKASEPQKRKIARRK
jgi:hypothetical protein